MEATKWLKPSVSVSRIGDSASVQAVTRVNAEQALYGAFEVKHLFHSILHFLHSSFFPRNRFQNHGLLRVTATSDRHRTPTMFCSSASESLSFLSLLAHAARNTTPAGTSPVVTRRHKAISNLRARATIIVLRLLPAPSVRVRYHWANALSF